MAVNLVGQVGPEPAAALLESSFAQFQADRAVVGLARQVQRDQAAWRDREAMTCHLGDFAGVLRAAAASCRSARRELAQAAAQRRAGPRRCAALE